MADRFVLPAPAARAALARGIELMTRLLRPTLGPTGRTVAIARAFDSGPPEILDHAATIARRTTQLACPYEDMGGMIVRQLVWTVHEEAGDGAATAAVLAQGLVREADRAVAAGWNPLGLKRGIERGLASRWRRCGARPARSRRRRRSPASWPAACGTAGWPR